MKRSLLFIMFVFSVSVYAQWNLSSTGATFPYATTAKALNSVAILDASTFVIVGAEGLIAKTVDAGKSWSVIQAPGPDPNHVNHVMFIDKNTGFVVANAGRIAKTTDGGNTWTELSSGVTGDLFGLSIIDSQNIIVSGTDAVLKSTDGGDSWQALTAPTPGKDINALAFVNSNVGFAGGKTKEIYRTTDGGQTWEKVYSATGTVRSMFVFDAFKIIAAGDGGIAKTTDGGASWTDITYPTAGKLWRIKFVGNTGFAVGESGLVISSSDGGDSWVQESTTDITANKLRGIDFTDAQNVIATGQGDAIVSKGLITTSVELLTDGEIPGDFYLSQNYPNPFNPSTEISFGLSEKSHAVITVYNIVGQKVAELLNEELDKGTYRVNFGAENLTSGVYFYRLSAGNFEEMKKMILIK